MRERISPYQLMILTFSYMISGFFLGNVKNFYIVILEFALLCLYAYIGYHGFSAERGGFFDFLRALVPSSAEKVTALAFLLLAFLQLVPTLVTFAELIRRICAFLPLWLIGLSILAEVVFAVSRGVTVMGRLAELLPFLLVPLLLTRPFFSFSPSFSVLPYAEQGALSFVSIAPIFYLLSKTVTAGDRTVSRSFRASAEVIEDRGRYLLYYLLIGGLSAVAVYGFLFLFEVKAGDVLFRIFVWWTVFLRLSLLCSIFRDLWREKPFVRGVKA